jgi:hypothetical protein
MKRATLLGIILMLVFMAGCTKAQAPVATDATPLNGDVSAQPVLYGMWMNDQNELLVFTEKSVYMTQLETSTDQPQLRESYYEIQSIDWVSGVITMNMKWVRVNGQSGGFDMPLHYMLVSINDTSLMYSMGDEGQGIPATADIGPFTQK